MRSTGMQHLAAGSSANVKAAISFVMVQFPRNTFISGRPQEIPGFACARTPQKITWSLAKGLAAIMAPLRLSALLSIRPSKFS